MRRINLCIFTFVFIFITITSFNAFSNSMLTQDSLRLIENLNDEIQQTLLQIKRAEENEGRNLDDFCFEIELKKDRNINLGLVLDKMPTNASFKIIAVVPFSLASLYGIQPKDELLSVNGIEVNQKTQTKILSILKDVPKSKEMLLVIKRQEKVKDIVIQKAVEFMLKAKLKIGNNIQNGDIHCKEIVK